MHTGNLEYYHLLEKEPYELRGSRTVLMGTQGEVPWVYLLYDFLQKQKECTKNLGEHHSIHRGETFPKSESEENGRGSYQQSEIPWI